MGFMIFSEGLGLGLKLALQFMLRQAQTLKPTFTLEVMGNVKAKMYLSTHNGSVMSCSLPCARARISCTVVSLMVLMSRCKSNRVSRKAVLQAHAVQSHMLLVQKPDVSHDSLYLQWQLDGLVCAADEQAAPCRFTSKADELLRQRCADEAEKSC